MLHYGIRRTAVVRFSEVAVQSSAYWIAQVSLCLYQQINNMLKLIGYSILAR
jgi:hypothetical protein